MNPVLILAGLWWAFALGASLVWLARTAWRLGHPYRAPLVRGDPALRRPYTATSSSDFWDGALSGGSLRVISDRERIDALVGERTYEGNDDR